MGKLEWQQLWDAMDANPGEWIETTEDMFWQMLECVPPRAERRGAFLVGEAKCHNSEGQAVHACFVHRGADRYFAKYMTVAEFKEV